MALDSSVLGCGSDDWSVDSDYAFPDFPDDANHQPRIGHQRSASNPDHVRRDGRGLSSGSRARASRARAGKAAGAEEKIGLHAHVDSLTGVPGLEVEEADLLPVPQPLGVGTEDNTGAGQEEQQPPASDARLLRDPGSSTDSTQILRLEQRMFLKVARSTSNSREGISNLVLNAFDIYLVLGRECLGMCSVLNVLPSMIRYRMHALQALVADKRHERYSVLSTPPSILVLNAFKTAVINFKADILESTTVLVMFKSLFEHFVEP